MNWTKPILIAAAFIIAFGRYANAAECFPDPLSALRAHPQYNHASYRTIGKDKCWFGDRKEVMRNGARRSRLEPTPLRATGAAIPLPPERPIMPSAFGNAWTPQDFINEAFFMIAEESKP